MIVKIPGSVASALNININSDAKSDKKKIAKSIKTALGKRITTTLIIKDISVDPKDFHVKIKCENPNKILFFSEIAEIKKIIKTKIPGISKNFAISGGSVNKPIISFINPKFFKQFDAKSKSKK